MALFFAASNLSFLAIAAVFYFILYILLKDLKQASFLMFIASLPLSKGKILEWILVPRENIPQFALYDIGYYFPLSPSFVFLLFSIYLVLRTTRITSLRNHVNPLVISFTIFLFICCIPLLYSPFPVVVGLSVIQLVFMGAIFLLPRALRFSKKISKNIEHILSGFVIFETGWVILQVVNRGPLGRYLEATLSLNRLGILSSEDVGFMRYNGTFFEPSILGTFMLMHILYFVAILLYRKQMKWKEKYIYMLSVICAGLSIIFTGSRGIYGLSVIAGFIWYRKNRKALLSNSITRWTTKIVVLSSCIILLVLSPYIIRRLESTASLFSGNGSGTYRLQLNGFAFRLAQAHPFGVGLNLSPLHFAYGFPLERNVDPAHPHSIFFQLMAETGLPGLLTFLIFLMLLYRRYSVKHDARSTPYMVASTAFLFAAQFYPIFISQPEILSFFFLHAGLMYWAPKKNEV